MQELLEFLNQNQGAVMVLLTFAYVFATIIIVYYTRISIREMKITRENENRPFIYASLTNTPRDRYYYLSVKNYGRTGANIKAISISPGLTLIKGEIKDSFLEGVALAPEQSVQIFIPDISGKMKDIVYNFHLEYMPVSNNRIIYSENYKLSLQYNDDTGYATNSKSGCNEWENALLSIANSLDVIRIKVQ